MRGAAEEQHRYRTVSTPQLQQSGEETILEIISSWNLSKNIDINIFGNSKNIKYVASDQVLDLDSLKATPE